MIELTMPSFSADMESGILTEWLVKPGDAVKKGEIIAVIETQKGAIDMEAFQSGIIHTLRVEPGSSVPVGHPIATLETEITADSTADSAAQVPPQTTRIKASPLARQLALHNHIDLAGLNGSGPEGAIVAHDLESQKFIDKTPATETLNHTKPQATGRDEQQMMRRAIASAMSRSKREIPHYYLATTIDLQPALEWMTHYNHDKPPEAQLLMTALLHKAVALALTRNPELNGFYTQGHFQPASEIHLGMAISMRNWGLITPALHHADQQSLPDLMQQMRDLTLRARRGGLRSSEMTDATITVSGMGDRGVETLFGIIYPPQVAIVGLGKPMLQPWVVDGKVRPRLLFNLTLAADHRVSDGHQGGRFLGKVNKLLQNPAGL
ncbi:2-oxo acid dehydrogenase subunit E2 [Pontibacterium sp. N1Y112]|uniref:Dihydrolipoamide acetyltransferase component of pyruvate dehydrogenase complex n=1 Tax=Pontibacterium sinense TaxID=2781979 RepID=A0A8J7JYX5_9GAMM|nr:dihydrolipoamide acetyltransferase family protein [Pontibacterium sinense]MBE9398088.1 2-oxo acid dehydrogenase subunit E2 [Pontibacterium sinense]